LLLSRARRNTSKWKRTLGGILAAFQGEIDVDADFKRSVDPEIHTQRGIRVTTKYLPLS
jgi:hypothetical protein